MEMAAAHGLAQRLVEMTGLDRVNRNELCEIISEEDRIIKTWFALSKSQIFRKLDFFKLLRKTLVFVLTESPLKEIKKKELLKVISIYFNTFSSLLRNNMDVRKPVIDIILEPWKNVYFSWDELFQRKITVRDLKVQEYFYAEPEEIILARVHVFLKQGKEEMAMILAKTSFMFHSRVAKHFSKYQHNLNQKKNSLSDKCKKGTASMDWYLFILQKKRNLPSIVNELKQLTCHEGILLILRLRQNKKNQSFAFTLLQILFMQELIRPSKFCCTKKIFCLWSIMHKEKNTSMDFIIQDIRKMVAMYAPSSAHFYLLVDALWKQFGSSFITVYVELYVRGLTVDINHLEAAKHGEIHEDVSYLECHIASMFAKLSTLFSDFHEGAARECMFSAFSLKPTKERLYILQSLTHSILSTENEMKLKSSFSGNSVSLQECKCVVRCSGSCNSTKEYFLEHPILMKGIPNVPYSVVKDLVSVLEGVRCISFQYNLFDWHNNATDIGDYLKDFNMAKSWESDTEYASEGSVKSDSEENSPINDSMYQSTQIDVGLIQPPVKRKCESGGKEETFALDASANIEVANNEFINKRIKIQDQNNEISKHDIFNSVRKPLRDYSSPLSMEDAIENVIRMTIDNNRQKSETPLNNGHNLLLNTSLNHANDGTEKLCLSSSIYTPVSENHVYPYSLTTCGKNTNLNSNFKASDCSSSLKPSHENSAKYVSSFASKSSCLSQILTAPIISRESVISPTVNKPKELTTMQEQSRTQVAQNKFYPIATQNVSSYNRSNETAASSVNNAKKIPIYPQEALNLGTKNSVYEQARSSSSTITQSSQFISNQTTMQVLSMSDVSKTQFLSNTPTASSCSMTSPVNVIQSKDTVAAQHAGYPSSSQCVSKSSVYRADSRYQVDKSRLSNTVVKRVEQSISCFEDNNFVHCDRSSVIQHTMQHMRESHVQLQSNDIEIPNQLSVSLNSNAIKQIRSAPKNDITNLPPFTVNVNDRAISNSSVAVSASLVIPRQPQTLVDQTSQPISKNLAPINNSETITIPGILASQSVIVSPWEAQRKSHGEFMYKKNVNAINTSSIDKRIYKNRSPHGRHILLKPEPKVCGQVPRDNNSSTQVFKALAHPSHISTPIPALPSSNQNNASTSHVWSFVNNSSSEVSRPTSSQPWYSEPYPKPHNSGSISKSSVGLNLTVPQNTSSVAKPLQLTKHAVDGKPLTMFTKSVHLGTNSPVSSVVSHSSSNRISSSTTSSVLNSIFSSSNSSPQAISRENVVCKDFVPPSSTNFHPNNRVNMKIYNVENNSANKSFVDPLGHPTSAMQLTNTVQDKNSVHYTTSAVVGTNLHYSPIVSKNCSPCCSPSEVNPCQSCSLPAGNTLVQSSSENISDRLPEQVPPGSNKMISDDLTSAAPSGLKTSNKCTTDRLVLSNSSVNSTIIHCQYCSHPFIASELEMHILKSHCKEFGVKNNAFITEINSDSVSPEKLCTNNKSLPLVPEQDSLFEKESFHSDLPQKTFVNTIENQQSVIDDDKNLDEIEAHAFSACMDLINSDKDLKRIVQGIDSFHQIDNNYLSFIPSNESPNNFLGPNLCSNVQEDFAPDAALQNPTLNNESDEVNNFSGCQEAKRVEVDKSLNCIFEFTEKEIDSSKPAQKLIHSKLQSSYSEKISAQTSKTSNELSFSTLAEMIKFTIGGDSDNGLESVEGTAKNIQKDIPQANENSPREWSCSLCSKKVKSAWSLKRHMKIHSNISMDNSKKTTSPKMPDISVNIPKNIHFENETASKSGNSYNDSSDSINHILQSDAKQNLEATNASENCSVLPKGRIKGIIKSRQTPCKFCGKVLTLLYMKKHILKQHPEILKKTDNSSSDANVDINVSSPSQMDSANIASLSSLLEQDIDSSTCLSVSDALKRNNPYTVTEPFSSEKLAENTNIKFNFNVLEFSKDTKVQSDSLAIKEEMSTNLEQPSNITKSDEERTNCNIPTNNVKSVIKPSCPVCSKSYNSVSGLNRHLKCVHNIIFQRKHRYLPNSLGSSSSMKNVNETIMYKVFNKNSDSNEVSAPTLNNETTQQFSEEHPIKNIPTSGIVSGLDQNTRHKIFSPNPNRTLLRAVLQSNFVAKQLKDSKEVSHKCDDPVNSEKNNSCDTFGKHKEQLSDCLRYTNCSPKDSNYECLKGGTLDHELKSNNKSCTSVPFDSPSKIQLMTNSASLLPSSSNVDISHEELDRINKVMQVKYTSPADSQNLSIQSNEISPISEIISNVSKCHFGGTSNIDDREYFEDNSLKLLIPENHSESSSKNEENIFQPDLPKLIQNKEIVQPQEEKLSISDESVHPKEENLSIFDESVLPKEENVSISDESVLPKEENVSISDESILPKEENVSISDESVLPKEENVSISDESVLPKEENISISDESDLSFRKTSDLTVSDHSTSEEEKLTSTACNMIDNETHYGFDNQNLVGSLSNDGKELSCVPAVIHDQKFLESKENSINISDESDVSLRKLDDSAASSDEENLGEGSCDLESTLQDSAENSVMCRLCHQYLSSLDVLSKHLKEIHDIPVLKKHISYPSSPELSHCYEEPGKLSPPKLTLSTNESDSESASGFDNRCSWSKSAQNGAFIDDNLCALVSPLLQQGDHDEETILQNSQSKLKKHFVHLELDETEVELSHSDLTTLQPSNCQLSNSEHLPTTIISGCKSKRASLCDIYSIFNKDLSPLFKNSKHLLLDSKNLSLKGTKQKSTSLPNLKFTVDYQTPNCNEIDPINNHVVHSPEENTTLSSVTEICKSSCDSLSSQNFPMNWSKITIKSPFSMNPILSSNISHHKSSRHKKKYRRKLLSKFRSRSLREKKIKKTSKGGYFPYHKKFKTKKTFKPIVLTLKETTEISEFLKTHKQPTVKLVRLKEEQEINCELDNRSDPVSNINCNKYNIKEAVVKLERMQIPKDFRKVVVIKQKLLVPNLLASDININSASPQDHESKINGCANDFYHDSSNADISHSENSVTQENSPKENISLTIMNELDSNTCSSESVQYLGTITKEANYSIKSNEFCTSPLKKCFVVLNRISV